MKMKIKNDYEKDLYLLERQLINQSEFGLVKVDLVIQKIRQLFHKYF